MSLKQYVPTTKHVPQALQESNSSPKSLVVVFVALIDFAGMVLEAACGVRNG